MDNFRKIDIDQYDEDVISNDELVEPYPKAPEQALADAKAKSTEVRSLIGRSDTAGALALVLSDYPYGPNVEEAKHVTLQSLLEIVNSTKSSDIAAAVKSISINQRDALMKYLYKGLELGGEGEGINCAVLLGWHERVQAVLLGSCPTDVPFKMADSNQNYDSTAADDEQRDRYQRDHFSDESHA